MLLALPDWWNWLLHRFTRPYDAPTNPLLPTIRMAIVRKLDLLLALELHPPITPSGDFGVEIPNLALHFFDAAIIPFCAIHSTESSTKAVRPPAEVNSFLSHLISGI